MNDRPRANVNRLLSASLVVVLGAFVSAGADAAQPTPPFPADACGYTRGATGCTANDTNDMSVVLDPAFAGTDPTSCNAGDDVTIHLIATVGTTATARYNLGILFAKDGKSPIDNPATTGATSCSAFTLPSPPFPELDTVPNSCGDQSSAAAHSFTTGAITVKCVAGPGGKLSIPYVGLWNNQTAACGGVTDLVAGTSSKCTYNVQTVDVTVVTPECDKAGGLKCLPVTRSLTLKKVWVNAKVDDAISVTTTGLASNATVSSTSTGNNTTIGNAVSNVPGATVTLPAESFTNGSQANYTTTVSCTGATPSSSVPPATFTMPDNDVTCTYTNTRKSTTLQLKKQWSNAKVGDSASLTATGLVNSATVALNSTADSANELEAGTAVTVYAGEVATLSETVNPAANYTSTGPVCTNTSGLSGSTLTVGPADGPIVCTYTNTRKQGTLQVKKTWVNAHVGDTASISVTGIANAASAGLNSTADSASETDSGSVVTMYAGETANFSESVNPFANYTSSFSCSAAAGAAFGAAFAKSVGDTYTMPSTPVDVICTYTNTRKSATLQLKKQWANAKVGDTASLTATGLVNSAAVALNSTADTANDLDAGSAVTVFAGEVATLSETVNPAANYTSTGPVCTGTSGLSGSTLTVGAADTAIVCTYTNTRKQGTLQVKKTWVNAHVGDTASISVTGIANAASAGLNSTADSANETDSGGVITMYAGETANFSESVSPSANYTSGFSCSVATETSAKVGGDSYTMPSTPVNVICTYTNTRKSATLQLKKQWSSAKVGDTASLTATGLVNSATVALNSTADTANDLDAGTAVTVYAGEVATLSETVNPAANYTSTGPVCTGTSGLSGSTLTVGAADTAIVCTYTNTRKSATLQLKKTWVNAKTGDTASLTATGLTNSATVALNSTADSANETDAGTAVAVYAGEVATLSESVSPAANYTSSGPVCTGTSGLSGSTLTVGAADTEIVCTYTNTRVSRSLTLKKAWVNGKNGDQVTVTTTGLAINATITSTSSGNNTDTGSSVSNPPGATVTLPAETFDTGSQSNYATTVACTGATASGSSPGATFTMPDNDVTCTYTNTRKSATLQLKKTWVNARIGDAVTVTATGIVNSAGATLNAVAGTNNETDNGSAVTVFAGEQATLAEGAITGSGDTYLQSFSCSGNANALAGSVLTVSENDTAIVCTFVNEWLPPAPPPTHATAIPASSTETLAMMAALLALLGAVAMRRRGGVRGRG